MIKINDVRQIWLGIQGENKAREIRIDVSEWLIGNPNGSFSIWMKAPGSNVPMATGAEFDAEEGVLSWSPSSTETYTSGEGTAEIRMTEGEVIKKTKEIRIGISPAVTGEGATLSSDWQAYINEVDRIKGLAVAAANRAEDEATHPPYINLNSYRWMIWDRTNQEYVDSGISAQGVEGPQGPAGAQGIQGPQGERGPAGPQGETGQQGERGAQGDRGPQGAQGIQGVQGVQGVAGPRGADGPQGERGPAFEIRKVYRSIAAMEADYSGTDVDYEEFVVIQTVAGQADNGKVYKKGLASWEFIVQMAGVEGPQGPQGPAGPQGIQGIQGEQGPQGETGATGPQGPKGDTGATGATGATGPQGPTGPQGIQGPAGPGVPAGGTAGQYLRKNSSADYDGDWESPANNLTTETEGLVLDARQGKVLKDGLDATNQALSSSEITVQTSTLTIRKFGKVCCMNGYINFSETQSGNVELDTIPVAYRPKNAVRTLANIGANAWTYNRTAYFTVGTDGKVVVNPQDTGGYTSVFVSCSWIVE